jgi:hypothetical protein
MRFVLAFMAVLSCSSAVYACKSDEGAPGPSGTSSSSGGTSGTSESDGGGGEGGAKKKIAEIGCTGADQCESGVCFVGNAQSFCTLNCTIENAPTVCVAPLTGTCNKQGFCKRD